MYLTKCSFFFFILTCIHLTTGGPDLFGQTDTSLVMITIEISAKEIRHEDTGHNTLEWNVEKMKTTGYQNLSELLQNETGVYIKSYGLGSLATSSIRGGSAGHTVVLWNGLPIQSPMLGLLDLSLLPLESSESIGFHAGGNAAMWGSGAIGGVVRMDNAVDFSQKHKVNLEGQFGSFGLFQQNVKLQFGHASFQSVTKYSNLISQNDFSYFPALGIPEKRQTNARLSRQYVGQDFYFKIGEKSRLSTFLWLQQSDRQIPPTIVQTRSKAHQDDASFRSIIEYQYVGKSLVWNIKGGYFNEQLDYFDDLILLEANSGFQTILWDATGQKSFGKYHTLLLGNFQTRTQARAQGYRDFEPTEYRNAFFATWKFDKKSFKTQAGLRQEWVDGKRVPLMPSFSFEWNVFNTIFLSGRVNRNYRLPTLNDRYWIPGGNQNLLPESGWSQELSLGHEKKTKTIDYKISATAFNRNIDNWILWSLREGQSFWSSNNITKVWSRGIESRAQVGFSIHKIKLNINGGYDFIRSTNQVALVNPKMAAGDQLIYTPKHQAFGMFSVEFNKFQLVYQHHFTGEAQGINEPLPAFEVANIKLQYDVLYKKNKAVFFVNIRNLWDVDYIVVERRPMPGIHFLTGFQLHFNHNQ